ncbi:MAG: alpha/beta hydrolase [Desulfobacteraceae bacterium]|jgi:pimeloyl-ACP methyl ester carboxylesterase
MKTIKKGSFEYIAGNDPSIPLKPDLLFIHGASLSKGLWKAQVQGLCDVSNPVALDLPGHGNSQGRGKNTISDYAKDVLDFIHETGLSKDNLVVCGMSMGGAIAQQLMIDHPSRFKAGILINTGARLKVLPAVFEAVTQDFNASIQSMPSFSLSPQTDLTLYLQQILEFSSYCDALTAAGDFEACNGFDVMDKIKAITCPVLVCSAEQDMSTPPKYGLWLKDHLPDAQHVHILQAGHLSMVEKAEKINGAIREFLSKIG